MNSLGSVAKRLVAVVVVLLVVVGAGVGYAAATFQQPTVDSVDSEWGEVTRESTEIRTAVAVNNPNPVGLPGVADVTYTTRLNDVVIAEGTSENVAVPAGRSNVTMRANVDNEAIARWWVTHVNNGERSTMSVQATVSAPGGVSRTIDVSEDTVETDLLGPMRTSEPRELTVGDEPFVRLEDQTAAWGEADDEETPVTFSAKLTNRHDHALTLDGVGYLVRMNSVTVGEGTTTEGVSIAPGETGTVGVTAALDTPKLADWWATHVRNGEETTMTVEMYGVVEDDGERRRVPLELFEKELNFRTQLLDGGATSVEAVPGDDAAGPGYEAPTVTDTDREWGAVTDETTAVESRFTVDNPNEGQLNEFLSVDVDQRVTINGVEVADDTTKLGSLTAGTDRYGATAHLDNSKVPEWWAAHVNDGERSTVRVDPAVTADVQFTKFDVGVDAHENTVETDLLAEMNDGGRQDLAVRGRTVAVVQDTSADWGRADAQQTPIVVTATIENTRSVPVTVRDLDYVVRMNDVTVADDRAAESHTIAPGETETVEFGLVLDSQRMDEWWVSHVRNDETTTMETSATLTVEAGGDSERVDLSSMTGTSTVETDFLGQEE